jgi:hypothetical protein
MYKLTPAFADCNTDLFFHSYDEKQDKLNGTIGYFNASFDYEDQYWSKWHDILPNLKTAAFEKECNRIISFLREDGQPFASHESLTTFIATQPGLNLGDSTQGPPQGPQIFAYTLKTENYSYYFRLCSDHSDCAISFIAYDNVFLGLTKANIIATLKRFADNTPRSDYSALMGAIALIE